VTGGGQAGVKPTQGATAGVPVNDGPVGHGCGQRAIRTVHDYVDVIASGDEQAESPLYEGLAGAGLDQGLVGAEAAAATPGEEDARGQEDPAAARR
jgi:hypothetical protein